MRAFRHANEYQNSPYVADQQPLDDTPNLLQATVEECLDQKFAPIHRAALPPFFLQPTQLREYRLA